MRRPTRNQHSTALPSLNLLLAPAYPQYSFEHIPGFVVMMMKVRRSNEKRANGMTARVFPFGNHKRISLLPQNLSRQRRRDGR